MSKIIKSSNFTFYKDNNANNQGRSLMLAKAIEDVENFFMQEKKESFIDFYLP